LLNEDKIKGQDFGSNNNYGIKLQKEMLQKANYTNKTN